MGAQEFISGLLAVIVINFILSGDNAVVIAMASRNLSVKQRKLAIFWGCAGSIILLIVLTTFAAMLLKIPYLQAIGGVLLIWIGIKFLVSTEEEETIESSDNLFTAIKTIIWADLLMSMDNVLVVAAASNGNYMLLVIGLAISIPVIIVGSQVLALLLQKFPTLIYIGTILITWTAGKMINSDRKIAPLIYDFDQEKLAALYHVPLEELTYSNIPSSLLNVPASMEWLLPAIITIFVCGYGWLMKNRQKTAQTVSEQQAE